MVNTEKWEELYNTLRAKGVTLVAVSKTKPIADIKALYEMGQRDFGENYVQELAEKQKELPGDIRWHFIGHLQSNKVKYIAPFIHLVHTVDSFRLLKEINKHAAKNSRLIDVLLQMHIADEETKFGMDGPEIENLMKEYIVQKAVLKNTRICGLMGMATNTDNADVIHREFSALHEMYMHVSSVYFPQDAYFNTCSMGMSSDYQIAIDAGSTMVRIGGLLFGIRE